MNKQLRSAAARACAVACALLAAGAHAQSDDLNAAREAVKKRDYAAAVKLLQPLVAQNDAAAMVVLGRLILAGQGQVKDELAAVDLFRKAAAANEPEGIFQLARQMQQGNGLPRDEPKAVALYKQAGELGHAEAQVWYGISLWRGYGGLTVDKAQAVEWFRRAVAQNNALGQSWLGSAYEAGEGVERDPYQAISLYRKAALQFEPNAQRSLGAAYSRGFGVARDDAQALKWLVSAAYLRDVWAAETVGSFYETGRTVVPDLAAAYMWYAVVLTRDSGRTSARTALDRVAAKLTPTQLAEAQARARSWPNAVEMARALTGTDASSLANPLAGTVPAVVPAVPPVVASAPASKQSYGSGFVVGTNMRYVLTNHHVVKDCKSIKVMPEDLMATVRAKDERNDLALLSVPNLAAPALKLRSGRGVRPGDELVTLGYPLSGLLASGPSVSLGSLTNLGGVNNDTSQFQISVPTQPGNSGGPVLDGYGQVVGVVTAMMRPLGTQSGLVVPQNVNFAVNTATLSSFLDASNVDFAAGQLQSDPKARHLDAASVGSLGRRSTVKLECNNN